MPLTNHHTHRRRLHLFAFVFASLTTFSSFTTAENLGSQERIQHTFPSPTSPSSVTSPSSSLVPPGNLSSDAITNLLEKKTQTESVQAQRKSVSHGFRDKTADLVVSAIGLIGIPYKWGGSSIETGFDCSGFVKALYENSVGLVLPRKASLQAAATKTIAKDDLKPGDLVFFNTMKRSFSHVGIYVGEGRFIHAPRTGASVRMDDMDSSYWAKRFNGARRVPVATGQEILATK